MNFEDLEKEFLNLMKKPVKVEPPKKYKLTPEQFAEKRRLEQIELEKEMLLIERAEQRKKYNKDIKKGNIQPAFEKSFTYDYNIHSRNKFLYNAFFHDIQIRDMVKRHPGFVYTHEIKFYDRNGLINNELQLGEELINLKNRYWKFKTYNKQLKNTIWYNMMTGYDGDWIPKFLLKNPPGLNYDTGYYTVIKTKAFPKIQYNNVNNNQVFRENDTGTCFYDGILNYFTSKYQVKNDKNVKAIINKLVKNEDKYKKAYSTDDIKLFCEELKISVVIRNLITGQDIEINKNKFNYFSVEFMNTKYNHLDLLMNTYNNIEEVELKELDEIKNKSKFYIETFGKVITLDKTYTKKKSEFEIVFNKWVDRYNINRCFIYTDSEEYNMINEYDFNIHRFFKKYSENELDYKELDLKKAYFNYSDINFNKHYLGLPSGAFISHSCENFNIEHIKTQSKNKIVGYFQVRIKNIKKDINKLDVLGFMVDSIHVLFTPTILLLSDFIEFDFLNASISPSVHMPFDKDLFMDGEKYKKDENNLSYYSKASGFLFKESSDINIIVKPLNEDLEFYKTFYNENYDVYYEDGIYNISINNKEKKSKIHLINSIHAYTTTLILENLLKMDIDKVLGVKLDSIVIDSDYDYDYDDKIFNEKKAKLSGMFCGTHAMSPEYEHFETVEDYERYIELNNFDCIDKYKTQSNNILNFKKIFTPNGEYIVKRKIYFSGIGGSGKTHCILENLPNKNICYTARSWDLIQGKQNQYNKIIGLSIPKITGLCNGQKVEQIRNNNIKFMVVDEMTLSDKQEVDQIDKLFSNCFIFLLGDISEDGFPYQCCINENQIYKPNSDTQCIVFTKTYRFNEDLNNRLLKLRENQYNNKDNDDRVKIHYNYFKELFSDRFFDVKDINFNIDDVGISTHDDTKKENALTAYFLENEKAQPQYYIKKTNIHNGQLRGQKLDAKPTHSNFECKLFKTIHAYQGRELTHNNKLIVFLGGLHDYNLLYTAVSRARRTEQIYIFDKY